MKYIDLKKLIAEIERQQRRLILLSNTEQVDMRRDCAIQNGAYEHILATITSLQQEQDMGEVSDGYHTFNELYYYRMLYNAAFFNRLPKEWVHKSKKHHTGEECFGGGWFIVMANLPTGQISNHYEMKDWDLFKVPEKELADEWDEHTPQEAAERLHKYIQQEQPMPDSTQLIELWNEDKEMLKEKDFRDDAWRLAYNAFLCGFGRGVAVKKQEQKCIFGNTPSEDICSFCSAYCSLRVPKTKVSTSSEIATPSGQVENLTFEEYLRGVFEINNGIENDPDNLVRIHAPELLKLARKHEQPEEELEKEIDDYYHENLGFIIGPNDTKKIVEDIARHFYSLGLNARKEE